MGTGIPCMPLEFCYNVRPAQAGLQAAGARLKRSARLVLIFIFCLTTFLLC